MTLATLLTRNRGNVSAQHTKTYRLLMAKDASGVELTTQEVATLDAATAHIGIPPSQVQDDANALRRRAELQDKYAPAKNQPLTRREIKALEASEPMRFSKRRPATLNPSECASYRLRIEMHKLARSVNGRLWEARRKKALDEIAAHFETIKREYKAVCRQHSVIQEDVAELAEIKSNPRLFDVPTGD